MVYVILGQTASGKTSLALSLARELSLPIISCDAYQCYKMMQIGTDKPTREETEGLDYYFYDEYPPDRDMDVFTFQSTMRPILESYLSKGKDVLVVGGTFLYVKALLFNYVFTKKEEETSLYDHLSLEELQNLLRERSEKTYNLIDNKNPRRLIRALEQLDEGTERSEILKENDERPLYPTTFLMVDIDKEEGNRKIDERIDKMFEEGIVQEVKSLASQYDRSSHSFLAIGYKEILSCLDNNESEEKMKELIKTHTHQYAKKQRTFLRHQFADVIKGDKKTIHDYIYNNIRFKERSRLLLSPKLLERIEQSEVLLAGLGGVGGQALLALVRLGFRFFTLLDFDSVDPSNLNRQALYDYRDIGRKKSDVCAFKIKGINPLLQVTSLDRRIENEDSIPKKKVDVVIDCIDDVKGKVLLYKKAKEEKALYLTSMGMGFHMDSTKVRYGTLKDCFDPLSRIFKEALLKEGYPLEEVDAILTVYTCDGRVKTRKNSKTIPSLVTVPNAGGLALATYLLKIFQQEETKNG